MKYLVLILIQHISYLIVTFLEAQGFVTYSDTPKYHPRSSLYPSFKSTIYSVYSGDARIIFKFHTYGNGPVISN